MPPFKRAASTYHLWTKGNKPLVHLNPLSKDKEFAKLVVEKLAKMAAEQIHYPFLGKIPSPENTIVFSWKRFEEEDSDFFPLTLEYDLETDVLSICSVPVESEKELEEFLKGKVI